jgi:general secretion pathway protein K
VTVQRQHGQAGFALLVVLAVVGLLALFSSQMIAAGRAALHEAAALRERAMNEAAADGAVNLGLLRLFQEPDVMARRSFIASIGGRIVSVAFEDETRKINPNLASQSLMSALLRVLGADPPNAAALAREIVDWRSPGLSSADGGLKIDRYRAAGLAYGPPGRLFRSIDELGLLPGMTPALLARLRPHLCLYLDNPVNPRNASPVVALALEEAAMDPSAPDDLIFQIPEQVVTIRATAQGTGRTRFTRSAIVRLPPRGGRVQPVAQILTWIGG